MWAIEAGKGGKRGLGGGGRGGGGNTGWVLQGKRSIRLQKSRDLQWAFVNIHSNRCHMIKPNVFELSLYQLKISGSELTVIVLSKCRARGQDK